MPKPGASWGEKATAIVAVLSVGVAVLSVILSFVESDRMRQDTLDKNSHDSIARDREQELHRDDIGIKTMEFYLQNKIAYQQSAEHSTSFRSAVLSAIGEYFPGQHGATLLRLFWALDSHHKRMTPEEEQAGKRSAEKISASLVSASVDMEKATEKPRVFIFKGPLTRIEPEAIDRLRKALESKGLDVRQSQDMPFGPDNSEVRYYYQSDTGAANAAASEATSALKAMNALKAEVVTKDARERASTHREHVLELWLGKRSQSTPITAE